MQASLNSQRSALATYFCRMVEGIKQPRMAAAANKVKCHSWLAGSSVKEGLALHGF